MVRRRVVTLAVIFTLFGLFDTGSPARSATPGWKTFADARLPSFGNAVDATVDSLGNVYVADAWFHEVQVVSPAGTVLHRWAFPLGSGRGSPVPYPTAVAVDGGARIYVADGGIHDVLYRLLPSGKRDVTWTPYPIVSRGAGGLTVDTEGRVYVVSADRFGAKVVQLSAAGKLLTEWRVASPRPGAAFQPTDVAVSSRGILYACDGGNDRIVRVNAFGKVLSAWRAAGGQSLSRPVSISVNADDTVNVLDSSGIQVFSAGGSRLTHWSLAAGLGHATVRAGVDGTLLMAHGRAITEFSRTGTRLRTWGAGGTRPGQFASPEAVAVGPAGSVFMADTGNNRIQKLSPDGAVIATWGSTGHDVGQWESPGGIAVSSTGSVVVADTGNNRVVELSSDGSVVAQWHGTNTFKAPHGVAVAANGSIYVADTGNARVVEISADGRQVQPWRTRFVGVTPVGIAVDTRGNVIVGEKVTKGHGSSGFTRILIEKFSSSGVPQRSWAPLRGPRRYAHTGVAVDPHGNVYATDSDSLRPDNHAVWEYNANGAVLHTWGDAGDRAGHFLYPQGIALAAGGAVYVADTGNNRIAVR